MQPLSHTHLERAAAEAILRDAAGRDRCESRWQVRSVRTSLCASQELSDGSMHTVVVLATCLRHRGRGLTFIAAMLPRAGG